MIDDKKEIFVLTSTFPRWKDDTDPPFVFELCKRVVNVFKVSVLCPHAPGLKKIETMEGVKVKRFQYFFNNLQSLAYSGGIMEKLKQNRLRYLLLPFFIISELFQTIQLLKTGRFCLANPHWAIPQGFICLIAMYLTRCKIPVVCSLHGSDVFGIRGKTGMILLKYVIEKSAAVVVVSNAIKTEIESLTDKRDKVHVISMGVDLKKVFTPATEPKRLKSVMFAGRLIKQKGVECLIKAFSIVIESHTDAILTIIGNGREEESLKDIVKKLGLGSNITFLGAVANNTITQFYRKAEVFVFPSIQAEGLGLVLVEAMGCECAVISSDLPATREIIKDMETGIIFKKGSHEMLADKINFLLNNPEIRKTMGKKARLSVLGRFDWEVVSERYRKLFIDYT